MAHGARLPFVTVVVGLLLVSCAVACGGDGDPSTSGGSASPVPAQADGGARVLLLDAATGTPRWEVDAPTGWVTTPVVTGETVHLEGTDDCRSPDAEAVSFALDAGSGARRWEAPTTNRCGFGQVVALAADGGVVTVDPAAAEPLALIGRDPTSGAVRWRTAVAEPGSPIVAASTLLVAADPVQGTAGVTAVDLGTGERRWATDALGPSGLTGGDGLLVSLLGPSDAGTWLVSAVDASSGVVRWATPVEYHERVTDPAVGSGVVVVSMSNGVPAGAAVEPEAGSPQGDADTQPSLRTTVVALDAVTGLERWRHVRTTSSGSDEEELLAPPAVAVGGDVAYEVVGGQLVASEATTGEERWRVAVDVDPAAVPVVRADGAGVYVVERGSLRAYAAVDGTRVWSVALDAPGWRVRVGLGGGAVVVAELGDYEEPEGG
ncbi:MAG: PQQ-like beta-propeller repeat protein [Acidimicrobiales bacterium]|jgi:outer membrane protein assembly factor BamB|nr:PQQ-like beta-propeller repeat protein [Acidimicrobiales bacterium]